MDATSELHPQEFHVNEGSSTSRIRWLRRKKPALRCTRMATAHGTLIPDSNATDRPERRATNTAPLASSDDTKATRLGSRLRRLQTPRHRREKRLMPVRAKARMTTNWNGPRLSDCPERQPQPRHRSHEATPQKGPLARRSSVMPQLISLFHFSGVGRLLIVPASCLSIRNFRASQSESACFMENTSACRSVSSSFLVMSRR